MLTGQPPMARPRRSNSSIFRSPMIRSRVLLLMSRVTLGFTHPNYAHFAGMPLNVRKALSEDFD